MRSHLPSLLSQESCMLETKLMAYSEFLLQQRCSALYVVIRLQNAWVHSHVMEEAACLIGSRELRFHDIPRIVYVIGIIFLRCLLEHKQHWMASTSKLLSTTCAAGECPVWFISQLSKALLLRHLWLFMCISTGAHRQLWIKVPVYCLQDRNSLALIWVGWTLHATCNAHPEINVYQIITVQCSTPGGCLLLHFWGNIIVMWFSYQFHHPHLNNSLAMLRNTSRSAHQWSLWTWESMSVQAVSEYKRC